MRYLVALLCTSALLGQVTPDTSSPASGAAASGGTAAKVDNFHFNLNWPSGLSIGEAHLSSSRADGKLKSSFRLEASVPGFALQEQVESVATEDFCSESLTKSGMRGKKKVDEKTIFDQNAMRAERTTSGGGKSELSTGACAKDALTFLHYVRRELVQGRLPKPQAVYYGGAYQIRLDYTGTQTIRIGDKAEEADRLTGTIKGAGSEYTIELFFARDDTRTPLLIQAPLAMGKFAMELAR